MKAYPQTERSSIRRFPVSPAPSPGSDDPDTGVVVRLSKGESGALQELMDAHWAPLVRYAAGILSGPADPQDLVQGVFLRLWDRRRRLKAQGSLKALLYTMVRNASLDDLRRNARRAKAEGTTPPPTPPSTPYQDVQGAELQRAAAAAVERLPAKRQEVFRLIREEGLTYQEVSQVLELSPQTVANHMSLALADLRVALKPFLTEATGPDSKERPEPLDREDPS
jgi:RNA polymerase sigma-70 factor (ECF subfamily)